MTRRKLFQILAGLPLVGRLVPEHELGSKLDTLLHFTERMMEDDQYAFMGFGPVALKREGQPWDSDDPTVQYCRAIFNKPFDA